MECPAHYEPTLTTADQEGRAGWRVPAWADDGDDCPGNPLVAHLHRSVARLSVVGIARPISHGFVSARSGTAVRPTTVWRERSAGDAPGGRKFSSDLRLCGHTTGEDLATRSAWPAVWARRAHPRPA
jgi:hypothetical protein